MAKKTLLQLAQEQLNQCSDTALVGYVKGGVEQNAIKAFQKFQYRIKNILG